MTMALHAQIRRAQSTRPVALLGIGTAAANRVLQTTAARLTEPLCCDTEEQRRFLQRVYAGSGIHTRSSVLLTEDDPDYSNVQAFYRPRTGPDDLGPTTSQRMALYAQHAPPLALAAAQRALDVSGIAARAITHLLPVTCTGFFAPGLDSCLIDRLHLRPDIGRLQLGFMGCHGAFNALSVARQIALANRSARILVCCVELCTLHLAYGFDPQKIVANALFADGAAAAVVGAPSGAGAGAPLLIQDASSLLVPDSLDAMTWRIGDHGFAMTLSPRIPDLVRQHVPAWIEQFLDRHQLTVGDIAHYAIHPGGPKVLTACADALGLSHDVLAHSRQILHDYGNMSSATILFVLESLLAAGISGPTLAVGFGPGLMAEGLLLGA